MKKLAIGFCGVLLSVLAISGWQITFANKPTQSDTAGQNNRSAESNESFSASLSIDAAPVSLTREVVEESQLIATGRCTDARSFWINERTLATLATVEIDETFKGSAQPLITVVLPGGVDLNRRIPVAVTYPGAPQIARGEKVFLFLTEQEQVPNGFSVTRYAAGKFSILEGLNGEEFVSRDLAKSEAQPTAKSAAAIAAPSPQAKLAPQNDGSRAVFKPRNAILIEKFKEQVQKFLR